MNIEESTLRVYDINAAEYAQRQQDWAYQEPERAMFLSKIKPQGKILDLGCGSGNYALKFKEEGYAVLAVDGAPGMVKLTLAKGVQAQVLKYSQLADLPEKFDGIWASYALLHVPKNELLPILKNVAHVLSSIGTVYASFREGQGEGLRDNDRYGGGRYFSFYSSEELREVFTQVFTNVQTGFVENRDDERGGIYVLANN